MKIVFAWYWIFGCALIGSASGWYEEKCPNDPNPAAVELAASVAIWPTAFFYMISGGAKQPLKCKVAP